MQKGSVDNRLNRRFFVEGMDIHAETIFATRVSIQNISMGGVSITTPKRLRMGGDYTLKLNNLGKDIKLRGKVVWESLSGSRVCGDEVEPVYTAGIQFSNLLSDKVNEVISFIGDNISLSNQRLTGLRFKLEDSEEAELNFPETHSVKNISAKGMRIITENKVQVGTKLPVHLALHENERTLDVVGRVVSCVKMDEEEPVKYGVGMEFADMSEQDMESLKDFIWLLQETDNALKAQTQV